MKLCRIATILDTYIARQAFQANTKVLWSLEPERLPGRMCGVYEEEVHFHYDFIVGASDMSPPRSAPTGCVASTRWHRQCWVWKRFRRR